ncbi:MAG: PAS domain S-box protein [candidate division Zixibacteria bacterium]|nr:PAS domain S-box protein [candidate division Zixibacteria bacterium]
MPQVQQLEKHILELEEKLASLDKINTALMGRIERSIDSTGNAFSLFESNTFLQNVINERTQELAKTNEQLRQELVEKKQAEEALRESEKRLKIILNTIQTGTVIIDPESHVIVDVNPMAAKMIDAPTEQIIGNICHKYICPAEKGKCPFTDLGQEIYNSERMLITAKGEEVPILKTVTYIILEGRKYILDSFIDITERKKYEREMADKMKELEEFNKLAVGRELKMIELKNEINQLLAKLGMENKY